MKTYSVLEGKYDTQVAHLSESDGDFEYLVKKNAHLVLAITAIHAPTIEARVRVRLVGSGAQATIVGFVIGSGESVTKIQTLQSHEAPDTTSNLLVKSALDGNASCIIDGGIRVEKKAQKTDAYQRNENILLSRGAHAESKPSLEILANDVRCTHGATVGPVSDEEVWFLATRGISKSKAQSLIVSGFFKKAVDLIDDESVRSSLWKSIEAAL